MEGMGFCYTKFIQNDGKLRKIVFEDCLENKQKYKNQ
jgi:hypothetical protein